MTHQLMFLDSTSIHRMIGKQGVEGFTCAGAEAALFFDTLSRVLECGPSANRLDGVGVGVKVSDGERGAKAESSGVCVDLTKPTGPASCDVSAEPPSQETRGSMAAII